ncbi:MAG: GspB domain-containing protein [Anaerolineaceae bacterium]|nr:GspB domain-containing protein [Anaerolineaceae bacterium]
MALDKGERRKVKILVVLVVVAVLVVGLQVLKKAGPSAAQAASGEAAFGRTALETALQQMRQEQMPMAPGAEMTGVCSVAESLEVFLGGKRMKGVSLESLSPNVFGVPEEFKTPPAPDQDTVTAEEPGEDADSDEPQVDPNEEALAKLQLEICMVSTRNRTAIINGQILHSGEMIGGFTVLEIYPGRVTLVRDSKQFTLTIK